jgi:hypothetical protein
MVAACGNSCGSSHRIVAKALGVHDSHFKRPPRGADARLVEPEVTQQPCVHSRLLHLEHLISETPVSMRPWASRCACYPTNCPRRPAEVRGVSVGDQRLRDVSIRSSGQISDPGKLAEEQYPGVTQQSKLQRKQIEIWRARQNSDVVFRFGLRERRE